MTIVIAFVVLFSCMSFYAHAVCETYSKTCTISIGQHLPYSENLNYAYLSADEDFYLTFSVLIHFIFYVKSRILMIVLFFIDAT